MMQTIANSLSRPQGGQRRRDFDVNYDFADEGRYGPVKLRALLALCTHKQFAPDRSRCYVELIFQILHTVRFIDISDCLVLSSGAASLYAKELSRSVCNVAPTVVSRVQAF